MKIKLLIATLLFSLPTLSQSITSFTSNPMTNFTITSVTSPINQTANGADTSWSFNNLTPIGNNIDSYSNPTTEQLSEYPGTTSVFSVTTQGDTPITGNIFLKKDDNGTSITGISQNEITLNYSTDNAFIGLFPLNFGSNNTDNVSGTFKYQTTSGTFTGMVTVNVEAYGNLTVSNTMGGNFTKQVTRLRLDQSLSFSIPPFLNNVGTLTQTSYYYYDNTTNNIAFRHSNINLVASALNINETIKTIEYNSAFTLSTNSIESVPFKIYPNPVNNFITINTKNHQAIESIKINNIQGKEIFTKNGTSNKISVSHLQKGMYFITLKAKSGAQSTKKIIKH